MFLCGCTSRSSADRERSLMDRVAYFLNIVREQEHVQYTVYRSCWNNNNASQYQTDILPGRASV